MKRVFTILLLLILAMSVFGSGKQEGPKILRIPDIDARPVEPFHRGYEELAQRIGAEIQLDLFPHVELYSREITELMAETGTYDVTTGMILMKSLFEPHVISLDDYIIRDFGSIDNFLKLYNKRMTDRSWSDGHIKFVPYLSNCQFAVYRKDLFEDPKEKAAFKAKYGYELEPPKTHQQFIDVAKFFTRPEEDLWGVVFMGKSVPGGWTMLSQIYGAGVRMIDPKTGECAFKSGEARKKAIQATRFWYDLIYTHKVAPSGQAAIGHSDCYEFYAAGKAAMSYGWWGDYWDRIKGPELIADIGETIDFEMPTIDPNEGIYNGAWYIGITKHSKNPDLAWEWIKWIISEEKQLEMSKFSGAASPIIEYTQKAVDKGWISAANRDALMKSKQPLDHDESFKICNVFWTYAPALYAGDYTPESFIDHIAKEIEKITLP